MPQIRLMREDDLEAVRTVDCAAFSFHDRQVGRLRPRPLRTPANVLASLALFPAGCFVAEDGGTIVGYSFSRHWGALGWVGPLGVQPERRTQGIGTRLLLAGVSALESVRCATIGLETMPDSPYNIGAYTLAGFRLTYPTIMVEKDILPPATSPLCRSLTDAAELSHVCRVSDAARPGLDYTAESRNALDFHWGETLLIGEPEPWAIALLRTEHRYEEPSSPMTSVAYLAIMPSHRERVPEAMAAVENAAAERGFQRLQIAAPGADWKTARTLLELGYRAVLLSPRMQYKGSSEAPPGVDCYRWIG